MRTRTVILVILSCCLLAIGLVGESIAQIEKPSAVPAPAQPTSPSESAPKIDKPSAAPVPADAAPRTDVPSTQPPPAQAPAPPAHSSLAPLPVGRTPRSPISFSGIAGSYIVQGTQSLVVVKAISDDVYYVDARDDGWEGLGFYQNHEYQAVFRYGRDAAAGMAGVMGQLVIDWSDLSQPAVQMTFTRGRAGVASSRWMRIDGPPAPISSSEGRPPKFDEWVYVEQLPEVVTRVPPNYPDAARAAHIDGTVQLQVLVVEDGSVRDVRVMKGVSGLDDAAVTAVRQWRFKPALSKGKPVSIWVAVPVRFSLN